MAKILGRRDVASFKMYIDIDIDIDIDKDIDIDIGNLLRGNLVPPLASVDAHCPLQNVDF